LNISNIDRIDENCGLDKQGIVEGEACWLNSVRFIMSSEQEVMLKQKARTEWLENGWRQVIYIQDIFTEVEENREYN